MVASALKFTQGIYTDSPGKAVEGRPAVAVTLSNGDDTGVTKWTYELLDVPKLSAVVVAVLSSGGTATTTFTPDVPGCYRVRVVVEDVNGLQASDTRMFVALDYNRLIALPGFNNATDQEYNYGSNTRGWTDLLERFSAELMANMPYVTIGIEMSTAAVVSAKSGRSDILVDGSQFVFTAESTGSCLISWDPTLFPSLSSFNPRGYAINGTSDPPGVSNMKIVNCTQVSATSFRVNVMDLGGNPVDEDGVYLEIMPR